MGAAEGDTAVMMLRRGVVAALVACASCLATDVAPEGTSTGSGSGSSGSESSTTSDTGEPMLELCDELITQADCEAQTDGINGSGCAWIEVRVSGPTCSSDAVVARCIGMAYVGEGCQAFACPAADTDGALVDGFFRVIDGTTEAFANPPSSCGLVATDGWSACAQLNAPPECQCLCGE